MSEQFAHFIKTKEFKDVKLPEEEESTAEQILTDKLKEKLSAASFEAAAITAAIDFENRAVAIYTEQAEKAIDPLEKVFYQWLADWEKGHHKLLLDIDQQLRDKVWHDNNFWPF